MPVCACGEIELSVDDQLTLIEAESACLRIADPQARRQFFEHLAEIMRDHHPDQPEAFDGSWVDEMLAENS